MSTFENERARLLAEYQLLSTERLLNEYHTRLYRVVLGSQAEVMTEAGCDPADVNEQREFESWTRLVFDVIGEVLHERGADPWENEREC